MCYDGTCVIKLLESDHLQKVPYRGVKGQFIGKLIKTCVNSPCNSIISLE
jgi:hypothetical protein